MMCSIKDSGTLNPNWDVFIKLQGFMCKRREKNCKSQGWWMTLKKQCLQKHQERYTCKFTETVIAMPAQVQARQNPDTEK